MASTSGFKTGMVLQVDNELWTIVEFQHVKVARGGAFVRTKLKNYQTGRIQEKTFRSGEKIDEAHIDRRNMQFLYREGDHLVLMDNETFEQISIPAEMIGSGIDFLKETEKISLLTYHDAPVGADLPTFVELKVSSTSPGFKGDTVSGATKAAVLETGGTVQVPLFIVDGDLVKVDTRTGQYIERIK